VFAGQLEEGLDVLGILGVEGLVALERIDARDDAVEFLDERFDRGIIAEDPVELRSVGLEEEDGRRGPDLVLVEEDTAGGFLGDRLKEDEILGQVVLILGDIEELLTEQLAARSGVGVEIEEELLVLGFGLGLGFVERALEEGIRSLGEGRRGEKKKRGGKSEFFHALLLNAKDYIRNGAR
jgi:hypothetical protein